MAKITFMGAGSTVFARNVLGDCMCSEALCESEIALYDIDAKRLEDSEIILNAINKNVNEGRAQIKTYLGVENRKEALRGADFVVNAIQVGGYDPCTITDFEIPKKYGLRQTIADSLGIGGIMRGLRTIPVMQEFANDIEEVCPDALFLNYTNPMGILSGYMQRYTGVRTIGLCHSVQVCSKDLLTKLGMEDKLEGRVETIAGINHMGWLLDIRDKDGNDLYPEIRKRAAEKNATEKHDDMVRFEYIKRLGYYCTESSEHNAEYNPFFIKAKYPELIEKYNIPLDEYPRRCIKQIAEWEEEKNNILKDGKITHERSREYVALIWYILAYLPVGIPVMKEAWEGIREKDYFSEFTLMIVATLGAFYIGEYPEGVAVMLFYTIGELFQNKAVDRAKRNIGALLDVRPEKALVLREDNLVVESPQNVKVGEVIEIKAGGRVPLDGVMLNEIAAFNTAALTGESVPRDIRKGEEVLAGIECRNSLVKVSAEM